MSRHRPLVVLLSLVLLAGCGGFAAPGGTTTETLTPASVPEDAPVAPGVPATEGEPTAIDADRLLAADASGRSAGYHLTRTVTIRGTNWTTRIHRDRRVAADGTLFERVEINSSGPLSPAIGRSELWTNGSGTYVRTFDASGNRIEQGQFPSAPSHFQRWLMLREQVLEGGTYRVESAADGAVLRSTELPTLPATLVPLSVREPRNVTARLDVTETGLIRSVRVRYDTTVRGEPVRVEIRHRLRAVGTTRVDRPVWVA
ncbi:hypothetical protein DP107_13740 [Haloglomus irregulare]|uniref:Uncharacterized protein n=1 Tax=Haloglomus irregulare TaxID=2234134 RepID=A0A554MY46_9EURY|nr:hypothetical protein [Haloglomus irregulare]TSD10044.1 hypothetical protein DP107_13740 [Haloglomus irregulare]